ncbi:MAG TPA: hypothetical protein VFE47_03935 [Tepidisphaeraceae bacterium]|jgi:hypothetical protein|nr:hypothetical protein [Tepidisphaeraceae bacterium]
MIPLTLHDLSRNAFRILGLTASASQAQIDSAARRMRIWQDPAMIPPSANDAPWIGPVPRGKPDIENAVARLAEPASRIEERFWWFCDTPPVSDDLPRFVDPSAIAGFHDAALIDLYRCLLTNAAEDDQAAWQAMIGQFKTLAGSDDYLQWLIETESAGDFEKRATLNEISLAQQHLPGRLSASLGRSVDSALAGGNFAAAAQAVQLIRSADSAAAEDDPAVEALVDRMEDDLTSRCNKLIEKIDAAWKTRRIAELRPACNHAIARFGTIIQPLIDQLVAATANVTRQNRAKMHGVSLLIHVADAYGAFENFMASERTLETAAELAAGTPMQSTVADLLEKVRPSVQRQAAGAPRGLRQHTPERKEFKLLPGGPMYEEQWLSWFFAIPLRYRIRLVVLVIGVAVVLGRVGCEHIQRLNATPMNSGPMPVYDSSHPPPPGPQR